MRNTIIRPTTPRGNYEATSAPAEKPSTARKFQIQAAVTMANVTNKSKTMPTPTAILKALLLLLTTAIASAHGTSTKTAQSSTTTSTITKQAATTVTQATTALTTIEPAITRCHASQLALALETQPARPMNQPSDFFRYANNSSSTCTLFGYPGIESFDANGTPINTTTSHGGGFMVPFDPGPNLVTLAPDGSAYAAVSWSTNPVPPATACPTPTTVESYPPNDYSAITVPVPVPFGWICDASYSLRITAVAPASVFLAHTNLLASDFSPGAFSS